MNKIKFGTDGWRAVIADEFTTHNVARVTVAVSNWLLKNHTNPSVVIGYDFRFGGKLFSETAAKILSHFGIKVYLSGCPVSTPAVSLAVVKLNASMGIMITASHNPPEYNGYKLKGEYGGPLLEESTREVEEMIPETIGTEISSLLAAGLHAPSAEIYDIEGLYLSHIHKNFDIDGLKNSGLNFAFDAMYGAGQDIMKKLFPDISLLHCENNPTFNGIPPEPLQKNLTEFSKFISESGNISCGLAVDGDADRIALFDEKGGYINSHIIILLLIHYLAGYKKLSGKIVTGFSSSVKVEKLCAHYNLPVERVHIGFKDICKVMLKEDVLVGGEESGGITVKGHIPERDGIWMGLIIWQFMKESGKSLSLLIDEIFRITGEFSYSRYDLKIGNEHKQKVIEACKKGIFKNFGKYNVIRTETLDGFKYFFNDDEWLMLRASGTEPLLRIYAESSSVENVNYLLGEGLKAVNEKHSD